MEPPRGGGDAHKLADECSSTFSCLLPSELHRLSGGQFVNNYSSLVALPASRGGFHCEDNSRGLPSTQSSQSEGTQPLMKCCRLPRGRLSVPPPVVPCKVAHVYELHLGIPWMGGGVVNLVSARSFTQRDHGSYKSQFFDSKHTV